MTKKRLAYASLCIIIFCASYTVYTTVHKIISHIDSYTLDVDQSFSPILKKIIQTALDELGTSSSKHYWTIVCKLISDHTSIDSATMRIMTPHKAHVTITAKKPTLVINDSYCISDDGTAFPKEHIVTDAYDHCVYIMADNYIPDAVDENKAILAWVTIVPPNIFGTYHIAWHDKTTITLIPCVEPRCTIQCSNQTVLKASLLNQCLKLINRENRAMTGSYVWQADIRFADQIILTKKSLQETTKDLICASSTGIKK